MQEKDLYIGYVGAGGSGYKKIVGIQKRILRVIHIEQCPGIVSGGANPGHGA